MEEFLPFPSTTTTILVFSCFLLWGKLNGRSFGGKWKKFFYFPQKIRPNIFLFSLKLRPISTRFLTEWLFSFIRWVCFFPVNGHFGVKFPFKIKSWFEVIRTFSSRGISFLWGIFATHENLLLCAGSFFGNMIGSS